MFPPVPLVPILSRHRLSYRDHGFRYDNSKSYSLILISDSNKQSLMMSTCTFSDLFRCDARFRIHYALSFVFDQEVKRMWVVSFKCCLMS